MDTHSKDVIQEDRLLAISLVRLNMQIAQEGRDGVSSVPTAALINQAIAAYRLQIVAACAAKVQAVAEQIMGDA